jgi:NAD-dependent dihydropyrimidine dehydrogenase PreA subunit
MVIKVDQDLCAGCGVCVDACSVGAIQLVDYWAAIDEALCTHCEACVDACPNGALIALSPVVGAASTLALPASGSHPVPARLPAALPEAPAAAHGLATLAGTALAYLGKEVLPYIINVAATTLEQRLASQPAKMKAMPAQPVACPGRDRSIRSGQIQRRRRSRKGQDK